MLGKVLLGQRLDKKIKIRIVYADRNLAVDGPQTALL